MAKCTGCGQENPSYVLFCGKCGAEIPADVRREARAQEEAAVIKDVQAAPEPLQGSTSGSSAPAAVPAMSGESTVACNWCGTLNKRSARYCSYCGKDPRGFASHLDEFPTDDSVDDSSGGRSTSGTLLFGGIFALLAGILALGQGIIYVMAESVASSLYGSPTGFLCLCGGLDILFGMGSLAAAIFAFQRRHYGLAVVGSVVGMLGVGLLIGFVFGLIALIMIAVSKEHFDE